MFAQSWARVYSSACAMMAFGCCAPLTTVFPCGRLCFAQESILVGSRAEQLAEQNIRAALRQPISWSFSEKPLSEFVDDFRDSLSLNVFVANKVLSDVGIDPAALPITFQAHNISAESALSQLLSAQGLTWKISGNRLRLRREKTPSRI